MDEEHTPADEARGRWSDARKFLGRINLWAASLITLQALTIGLLLQDRAAAESTSDYYDPSLYMPDISTVEDLARDARDNADRAASSASAASEAATQSERQAERAADGVQNLTLFGVRCN